MLCDLHGRDPFKGEHTEKDLQQDDVFPFLRLINDGEIPLYVSYKGLFICSVAIPAIDLPSNIPDMGDYSVNVGSSFGYWNSPNNEPKPEDYGLCGPDDNYNPDFLQKGIP
jgi:hypothetical protein